MTKHIGIVACSAEGAALCYRTICAEGMAMLGGHRHPEVSMHTPPLSNYVARLEQGDLAGIGALMLESAHKLARTGADFLICPDNTIHQALPYVMPRSPRPWLHIAEIVGADAASQGFTRLGLLGTRWLVDSDVYPLSLRDRGIEWVRPTNDERDEISRIIMQELVNGTVRPEAVTFAQGVIARLRHQGCDAVVLGCTELPILLEGVETSLPTLDSTRLLARAALVHATQAGGGEGIARPDPSGQP